MKICHPWKSTAPPLNPQPKVRNLKTPAFFQHKVSTYLFSVFALFGKKHQSWKKTNPFLKKKKYTGNSAVYHSRVRVKSPQLISGSRVCAKGSGNEISRPRVVEARQGCWVKLIKLFMRWAIQKDPNRINDRLREPAMRAISSLFPLCLPKFPTLDFLCR